MQVLALIGVSLARLPFSPAMCSWISADGSENCRWPFFCFTSCIPLAYYHRRSYRNGWKFHFRLPRSLCELLWHRSDLTARRLKSVRQVIGFTAGLRGGCATPSLDTFAFNLWEKQDRQCRRSREEFLYHGGRYISFEGHRRLIPVPLLIAFLV